MSSSKKSALFQERVKIATDFMLRRLSEGFSFKIELKNCEVYIEKLVQTNESIESKLELCCKEDIKPLDDFYEELLVNLNKRLVEISFVLNWDLNQRVNVVFVKVEGIVLTPQEEEKFKTPEPPNLRFFEILARLVIADAVKFGVEWALGRY